MTARPAQHYNRSHDRLRTMILNHLERHAFEYGAEKTANMLAKLLERYREEAEADEAVS